MGRPLSSCHFTSPIRRTRARLMRRQNRKTQAKLGEQFESFQIDGGFREPHSFRRAVKSFFEVAHAPDNLSERDRGCWPRA